MKASQDFKCWSQVNLELSRLNYSSSFECHGWEFWLAGWLRTLPDFRLLLSVLFSSPRTLCAEKQIFQVLSSFVYRWKQCFYWLPGASEQAGSCLCFLTAFTCTHSLWLPWGSFRRFVQFFRQRLGWDESHETRLLWLTPAAKIGGYIVCSPVGYTFLQSNAECSGLQSFPVKRNLEMTGIHGNSKLFFCVAIRI